MQSQIFQIHQLSSSSSKMKRSNGNCKNYLTSHMVYLIALGGHLLTAAAAGTSGQSSFPGVSRDLASFCAARPSLPIELAAMVVHVKKSISFNYKLYLFSADHVFQTGQVIPRDEFRIHSFPVKVKRTHEFWPPDTPTLRYSSSSLDSLQPVPSDQFNLKQFLSLAPLKPRSSGRRQQHHLSRRKPRPPTTSDELHHHLPAEAHPDGLPGDASFISHDVALAIEQNPNRHIHFDRDDQLSLAHKSHSHQPEYLAGEEEKETSSAEEPSSEFVRDALMPVGAFSSFHVNLTYLVRKDFGKVEPELVRILVDAQQFQVSQVQVISNGSQPISSYPANADYDFLSHKLLRDTNTRITAISQVYEDWITRNFYTLVYIQRRLEDPPTGGDSPTTGEQQLVSDRLVFRGSSAALLGADQLDYAVKAAAFITEKNGLHYYLEFLTSAKFYLCAVDWTKRPFRMIDSRRFPIRATKVQLDNEELLLCPPAVCYSGQPVDELVSYGRIALPDHQTRALQQLTAVAAANRTRSLRPVGLVDGQTTLNETNLVYARPPGRLHERQTTTEENLNSLVEAVKLGANQLQTRLHLRDWVWVLSRATKPQVFELRYELARRNDIKVKPDTYGYVLTGSEIEASYRVYNELYLISANHLITINYTLANETVISSQPLSDEFFGLSSTLLDPITGAFYDRYDNQIYFFKGDRYVGYDYATKKPLPDFVLQSPQDNFGADSTTPLVSTLPVVGILGRQHQVDAVYHDFAGDAVYVFSGMKFYTLSAAEFKNGTFQSESKTLAPMQCVNEHFLSGCHFDKAFRNPCRSDSEMSAKLELSTTGERPATEAEPPVDGAATPSSPATASNFSEQQQMKLRSIASRTGLLKLFVQNSLLSREAARSIEPSLIMEENGQVQEKTMVLYLLTAMIALTVLVTVVLIVVVINWTKVRLARTLSSADSQQVAAGAGSHYLSNQQHHSRRQQQQLSGRPSSRSSRNERANGVVKPLGQVSVVVAKSRRQTAVDNSVL